MLDSNATVIATFRHRMRLRFADGEEVDARVRGRRIKPVCGDRVAAEPLTGEDEWLITAIGERRNALTRPNRRGSEEVLAANLDALVVVASVYPAPDWFVVDRYLCAAEIIGADALVVLNKCDLAQRVAFKEALNVYRNIGYDTLETSAASGENVDRLAERLRDRTAIVVGQSGVGKSSLINRLATDADQRTAEVSRKHREGKHTTVNSIMIPLAHGGAVIDSPGVRDYAPYIDSPRDVADGYREIRAQSDACRFTDCKHQREPDCAVKSGVADGSIDERRYESYRRTLVMTERLSRSRQ